MKASQAERTRRCRERKKAAAAADPPFEVEVPVPEPAAASTSTTRSPIHSGIQDPDDEKFTVEYIVDKRIGKKGWWAGKVSSF